jgi:hypothetical protein
MPYSLRQFFMAMPVKLREEDKIKRMVLSFLQLSCFSFS